MPGLAKALEKTAGLLELLGPRALREISTDHDQRGLQRVNAGANPRDKAFVVRSEMEVGQMNQAGHGE